MAAGLTPIPFASEWAWVFLRSQRRIDRFGCDWNISTEAPVLIADAGQQRIEFGIRDFRKYQKAERPRPDPGHTCYRSVRR